MKRIFILSFAILILSPKPVKAWGWEGHAIVVKLALQFVSPEVRAEVLAVLGNLSPDSAGNWMDSQRSNSNYDFMKPWHYLDAPEGAGYTPSTNENIVNRIIIAFNELRHKNVLCAEQIKFDLLQLLHLMGDLHQPLHTGYESDLGGNRLAFQFDTLKTNLHKFWDEDILRYGKITIDDCLTLYNNNKQADSIDGIHPAVWWTESRSLLPSVYNYEGFTGDAGYLARNKPIVIRQLLVAGLRLAAMLEKLFVPAVANIDFAVTAAGYKNGILAADALQFLGKKVTACGKVYGVKKTDKVTFLNVGAAFPNSPLTIVIFAKDYGNFTGNLEELFANKNICVKGEVVEYKGKAEIIITKMEDVEVK